MKWWLCISLLLNILLLIMLIHLKRECDEYEKSWWELASVVSKAKRSGKL